MNLYGMTREAAQNLYSELESLVEIIESDESWDEMVDAIARAKAMLKKYGSHPSHPTRVEYCNKGSGGNLCSRNEGHAGMCGPYEDEVKNDE